MFKTKHEIVDNDNKENYYLDFHYESLGTRALMYLTTILFDVLKYGKVLLIDELEKSLHPLITEYIIKIFADANINKNNA